jgi:hypothetical protein
MKAVFATIVLSLLSAVVGVFSITELCAKARSLDDSNVGVRATARDANPMYPRQKIQQWVNH